MKSQIDGWNPWRHLPHSSIANQPVMLSKEPRLRGSQQSIFVTRVESPVFALGSFVPSFSTLVLCPWSLVLRLSSLVLGPQSLIWEVEL